MARAELLRSSAKIGWARRLDRGDWPRAEEAAIAAATRTSVRVPISVRRKATKLAELVAAEAKAAKDNEALINELATARAAQDEQDDLSSQYRRAFEEYGLPVTAMNFAATVEMLTTRLQGQPELVHVRLASYLDEWAFQLWTRKESPRQTKSEGENDPGLSARLTALARAIDPDSWRSAVRDSLSPPNLLEMQRTLIRLSEAPETALQPAPSMTLLAGALVAAREPSAAVSLLESARFRHHDDPWVHQYLGLALRAVRPPRTDDALRAFSAATALRPEIGYELAIALKETGRTSEAITVLADVAKRRPSAWYFIRLGEMETALGRRADSDASYARAKAISLGRLASRPDDALEHFYLGHALKHSGDFFGAITAFREAIRLRPDYPQAYCGLGLALRSSGHLQDAIAACREAIRLRPDLVDARNSLGIALFDANDLAGAIREHRETIRLKPDYASAYFNLGLDLTESKDIQGAMAAYREAVRLEPDYALAYTAMGLALRKSEDLTGSIAAYREAIRLKPDYAVAHSNLAVAYRASGKLSDAIAESREAIRLDPKLAVAHRNLGAALQASGDLAGAGDTFREATRLLPKDAEAQYNLGVVLYNSRKWPDAIAAYRKAIDLNPGYAPGYNGLGFALAASNDPTGAGTAFRELTRLKPQDAEAYNNLGVALEASGDLPGAIAAFRHAIRLGLERAHLHCILGHSLLRLGLSQEALTELECGHALGSRQPGWKIPSAAWLEQTRSRLAELESKLPMVLAGTSRPKNAAERAELAAIASTKMLHAAAALLYTEAFAEQPALAGSTITGRRYNAALSAAMASLQIANDDPPSENASRASLRKRALEWLEADLASWAQTWDDGSTELREAIAPTLRQWKAEARLAGVRDEVQLADLPEKERDAWRKFWSDVDTLLIKLPIRANPIAK